MTGLENIHWNWSITGDEEERRIKNIPMINPHNLEGVGMGEN
jgi:hypothetical protein